ncbi:MAG TPA: efflux RND transporter periplasmic adaptor subunit [Candidatus Acidoferrales bacterium]|nr:efflux RND transporter periplasmic adaptor subunit [Candidatus Acidoferrales bacterium]
MNKIKIYSVVTVVFALIVVVLLHNRSQIKAETKKSTLDAYTVSVATVDKREIADSIDIVGTIDANNDVAIVSEAQGKVTKVFADVGDYRAAGSVLIQIDDELALAAMNAAKVNFEKAKKDHERFQELYKDKAVTDAQLENAELAYETADDQYVVARRQYENTRVTAPISGIVTSRVVDVGTYVNSKTVVADIVDISKLKTTVNVDEHDVFGLKVGDRVEISTGIYPGVRFSGFIKTISVKGDASHTYPVEVDFSNGKEHPLKAGMFAHVLFAKRFDGQCLTIPRQALVGSVEEPQVYTVENGIARLRNVVIGSAYDNYLEVLDGLHEGETVVINGQNNLQDGSKVSIVE